MLGFIKTIDRATGETLYYYPWSKKRIKKYNVIPTYTNADAKDVRLAFKMSGLSNNDIDVEVNLTMDLDEDGQGIKHIDGLVLEPSESFSIVFDLSSLTEKERMLLKKRGLDIKFGLE